MSHPASLKLESPSPVPAASAHEEDRLHEALKHCPPSTYEAARQFRQTHRAEDLRTIVNGVLERYVSADLRERLRGPNEDVLLVEHLGLDSLTLMEIMMRLDDVFPLSIPDEDLRKVRTLGEVRRLIERNVAASAS